MFVFSETKSLKMMNCCFHLRIISMCIYTKSGSTCTKAAEVDGSALTSQLEEELRCEIKRNIRKQG